MDKAQPILDCYPQDTVQLSWIMGHDTMIRLFDPKYYKDVHADMAPFFERCDVICSSRPGYGTRDEMMQFVEQSGHKDKVTLVDIDVEEADCEGERLEDHRIEIREMSSTAVRNAVSRQDWTMVERSVLPSVRQLIEQNGLYKA
jgi:nicotinamide-nucleotide adenylyltransferase